MYFAGDAVAQQQQQEALSPRSEEERGKQDDRGAEKGLELQSPEVENESKVEHVEDLLDTFGDAYLNKHLVYSMLELIMIKLIPEMAELGIEGLMAERLG